MATKKERRAFVEGIESLVAACFAEKFGEALTEDEARSEVLRTLRRLGTNIAVATINRHVDEDLGEEKADRDWVNSVLEKETAKAAAAAEAEGDDDDDEDDDSES